MTTSNSGYRINNRKEFYAGGVQPASNSAGYTRRFSALRGSKSTVTGKARFGPIRRVKTFILPLR
jgi:hypothetical protein